MTLQKPLRYSAKRHRPTANTCNVAIQASEEKCYSHHKVRKVLRGDQPIAFSRIPVLQFIDERSHVVLQWCHAGRVPDALTPVKSSKWFFGLWTLQLFLKFRVTRTTSRNTRLKIVQQRR
jgi:hypothetical protein